MSPESQPRALTDSQLDQIMRCAAPLDPQARHAFVERVAHALRGKIIGDGEVLGRAEKSYARGLVHPPLEDHHHGHHKNFGVGKYA